MARATPGAELEIIPGARHMMNLTEAARVNQVLLRWLARPLEQACAPGPLMA
jgi:pimeloyl-ACP methyl ester carboxylesterase